MNNNSHWKILSVRPLLQICAFLRPSDTKRISTCRCQQRSETSQEIKRSQTSWSLWLKFHPRFCGCWSRTRIHSSEFPSMTHVGFAPVALSFLSQTCAFCANGNFQKKKQETGGMNICQFGNMTTSPSQPTSYSLQLCSSADVKLKLLKLRVFSQPDFRHLPPPSRSWTQPPGGFETNGDRKPSASRWASGCVPCSACRGRYLEAP